MNQSFGRKEKLKSKIFIGKLFSEGKTLKKFPLKLIYTEIETSENLNQIGVSVPKKNFKLAVKRNYLKRLLRESYRKNKYIVSSSEKQFAMMFIYLGKETLELSVIEEQMQKLLAEFVTKEKL
ncbi:ribonuclease P protein component [Mesonia maritima]|uniref:Ribonuclease P protein component n=1 Tax=Mesonia maritima TaxID=1793873 RepID=A0ABU1K2D2_9FLAO|nr:ribonuclease P protein component [Mesonia maritima]MDR6299771.1 ribonuclease P protein component [Mesonia maritima]